ncbi:MAG: CHASE3 domain-containing protein [Chitinophagaceae bacterium]|nr:CHASE3 domain-containing protein [Chitinophagaceae bacterium]
MFFSMVNKIADKIRVGYLTAFVLILISYVLTFYTTDRLLSQAKIVNHTNEVINKLNNLLYCIKEDESSFRGYIITNNEGFLGEYHQSPANCYLILKQLSALTNDNPAQQNKLDTLKRYIDNRFAYLKSGIDLYSSNKHQLSDSLRQVLIMGRDIMDSIRFMELGMQNEENSLMIKRSARFVSFSNTIKIINILSLLLAVLLGFYTFITFNKENKAKKSADDTAEKYRNQLQERVDELYKLNIELLELRGMEKFAATGRIARTIAHEVRNPLTNINLAAEQLRSDIEPGGETGMLFDMITRNSKRINQLISDLLDSTKSTNLNFEKLSINNVLDSSLEFAQDRIELKAIKVVKSYAPDICPVQVDFEKINTAFLNIIVNAVEAMEQGNGILKITTENMDDKCIVTISDNGKGMPKSEVTKLFEPYYTTKEKGTGLGLTNTLNIVLSHNATVVAKSVEGVGTSFIITFAYAD